MGPELDHSALSPSLYPARPSSPDRDIRHLVTAEVLPTELACQAGASDGRGELVADLRSLVESVTLPHRPGSQNVEVEMKGD